MEGRSLTEDEIEAKFTAFKEEFFQDLEIKLETLNQDVDHLKIVTKMIEIDSCPDMARHGIVESGFYDLNLGSIGSPTKGFCNLQEGKFRVFSISFFCPNNWATDLTFLIGF